MVNSTHADEFDKRIVMSHMRS